jgi:dTDP-4-dehydrorhamnose 3,5-epimerase-like enzyme
MQLDQVKFIDLPSHEDPRGILTSIEQNEDIPFEIKRIFYVHHIKGNRGCHAPIDTDEVLIPISGSFYVNVFDGVSSKTFFLNDLNKGLFIPRMIFLEMYDFSEDAVCLVLANTHYDADRYLRTMEDFKYYLNKTK